MPIEASLMAILAISLAYASLRLLQKRKNAMTIIFVISTILFLLLSSGFLATSENKYVAGVLGVLSQLPVAGARGLLLGIGLGSLVTGLRILLGSDRPFSG
jgi:succinate-acetate transporter protein